MKKTVLFLTLAITMYVVPSFAAGSVVGEARVKQVITDFIRQKTENLGVEVTVRRIAYSGDLKLPEGKVSYEVLSPQQWEGWGRANLALIVRVNDQVEKNIPINVEVEALADTVVSSRPLERGDVIGQQDVALQKRDLAALPASVCRSLDEVLGKRVRVAMRGNAPLRGDYLEKVPLVKSGQVVTIVLENQSLRVTASGRSRSNGGEGDTVMVQNLNSQKQFPARVIGPNLVQVEF